MVLEATENEHVYQSADFLFAQACSEQTKQFSGVCNCFIRTLLLALRLRRTII
jgi:hypothetical protein